MALTILSHEISADLARLENRLSEAKISAKSLLALKDTVLVLVALANLADALRVIHENSMQSRVRVSLALEELEGRR